MNVPSSSPAPADLRRAPHPHLPLPHASSKARDVACGVFTGSLDAAKRMRDKRYRMVVVANDIELVGAGVRHAMVQFHDGAKHG